MDNLTTLIGFCASLAAASIFFPQVYASYTTKRTKDLAWSGIIIGMVNGALWIIYGLLKNDPFIYVTNTVLLMGAGALMVLKYRYH